MAGAHDTTRDCQCPHEHKIQSLETRVNEAHRLLGQIDTDTRNLIVRQTAVEGEIKLLSHKIEEGEKRSVVRHQDAIKATEALLTAVNGVGKKLDDHVVDAHDLIERAINPVRDAITGLYSRWWTLATALIVMLSGGVIGLVVYIWQTKVP
jgi:chromosome segregation ATPase